MPITWQLFPKSLAPPTHIVEMVGVFENVLDSIGTPQNQLNSNEVLDILSHGFIAMCCEVESKGPPRKKVKRPVLFGLDGSIEQHFDVDAFHTETGTGIEVEAGRAVINHQFLKDLFEACAIQDARYLCIAVAREYKSNPNARVAKDFEKVVRFFETLYASGRLALPLEGVVIIGY